MLTSLFVPSSPSYQSDAVAAWKSSNALQPPATYWNPSGRAYPDVAALAHKYLIVENGEKLSVDGTSASCPVTAGIVALINDNRLNNGQSPVGFINPALYAMSASNFNDVTIGNNTGTEMHGRDDYCFTYGYGASAGWDPCVSISFFWLLYFLVFTFFLFVDWYGNPQLPSLEHLLPIQQLICSFCEYKNSILTLPLR